MSDIEQQGLANKPRNRRAVVKGAAWSVPVIAAAIAAPAASASGLDAGAFALNGTCGVLAVLGPGFTLTASATAPIPAGTTIAVSGSGIANIGVFSITGGLASVSVLSGTDRLITLDADLAPGATLEMRTTLSISVAFTLNAVATVPAGDTATGAKTSANVSSTLILCSAN
ncbi:hypothetical protein JOF48_000338 [Arthrobacter stackebrandtii]|uniref:Uncharacterized protein n=1 Tax=Arthrobacter stackebrandtii TaxID=272161 RepID=A0ABS4YS16_9MICC|nr:hypothetical protein [Arthrobacter stackebrandtii]MBP2411539.1 hypothetical protein [Arthrobacter stackebrandtii]